MSLCSLRDQKVTRVCAAPPSEKLTIHDTNPLVQQRRFSDTYLLADDLNILPSIYFIATLTDSYHFRIRNYGALLRLI